MTLITSRAVRKEYGLAWIVAGFEQRLTLVRADSEPQMA